MSWQDENEKLRLLAEQRLFEANAARDALKAARRTQTFDKRSDAWKMLRLLWKGQGEPTASELCDLLQQLIARDKKQGATNDQLNAHKNDLHKRLQTSEVAREAALRTVREQRKEIKTLQLDVCDLRHRNDLLQNDKLASRLRGLVRRGHEFLERLENTAALLQPGVLAGQGHLRRLLSDLQGMATDIDGQEFDDDAEYEDPDA